MSVVSNDDAPDLLNIKQAAKLLNVSEVSLRRWTDSGRLPCIRVGVRRERRFRREDLFEVPASSAANSPGGYATVELEGISIDYSNHLCALYETDLGRIKMAVPFLAEGIGRGDACFLVASDPVRDHFLSHLRKVSPGLDRALSTGLLKLLDGFENVDEALDAFAQAFVEATQGGNRSLRVLGDMAWFFDKGMSFDDLERFEMTYNNKLAHAYPVVSLCLYDVRRFDGRHVLGALKCHEDTFKYPLARFLGP